MTGRATDQGKGGRPRKADPEHAASSARLNNLVDNHWQGTRGELNLRAAKINTDRNYGIILSSDERVLRKIINATQRSSRWVDTYRVYIAAIAVQMSYRMAGQYDGVVEELSNYVFGRSPYPAFLGVDPAGAAEQPSEWVFQQAADETQSIARLRLENESGRVAAREITYCLDPNEVREDVRVCLLGFEIHWAWTPGNSVSLHEDYDSRAARIERMMADNTGEDSEYIIEAARYTNAKFDIIVRSSAAERAFTPDYGVAINRLLFPEARLTHPSQQTVSIHAGWGDVRVGARHPTDGHFTVVAGREGQLETPEDAIRRLAAENIERLRHDFSPNGKLRELGRCVLTTVAGSGPLPASKVRL